MRNVSKEIIIDATINKVWNVLFNVDSFELYTKVFNPTSTFKGEFKLNEEIFFYDAEGNGLKAKVSTLSKPNNLTLKYTAEFHEHKEFKPSTFIGGNESYLLTEIDNKTKLNITLNIPDDFYDEFNNGWDVSLQVIKELCEKG